MKSHAKISRNRFRGCLELLESRLMLTGPYTNFQLDQNSSNALLEGSRSLAGLGERIDQSENYSSPLGPIKNADGSPLTPGILGPYGRTLRDEIQNPIQDYFDATPVDQRSTDSLIAHLGTNPAFLSIEGGLADGTIDQIVFDIHLQREYDLTFLNIEFESQELPSPFYTKNGLELNLTATVDVQYQFGFTLDPALDIEQAVFVRDFSISSSIRADTVFHPFLINLGILEASVPDVVLAANLDLQVSQPTTTPSLRLTEINTLEVNELLSSSIGNNNFNATFNLDVGLGQWRLAGSTYVTAIGNWLGFSPVITFSPNFDELFLFGNITSGEIVAGMENFQAWLTGLSNSSEYDIPIPFAASASTGSVYDLGQGMSGFTANLRDEDGNPAFDNVGNFPYSGIGIDYHPETNKIVLTIIQDLPEQELQSRNTRVTVDDTLGLDSNTEAVITGAGTLNLVVSVNLSDASDFGLTEVSFLDRIAVEHLSVRTNYGTQAVLLSGNAAYGGLGLAFINAILAGHFSTQIEIGDLNGLTSLTLRNLNTSFSHLGDILVNPIQWIGEVSLRVPGLSVMGNLFGLAADASIVASVNDIAGGMIETTTNTPDLLNFQDVSFEGLAETLGLAIVGTQNWDSEGDAAVATLGISLDDFGPLQQDRIADALTDAVEHADTALGLTRRVVQDAPELVESLQVSLGGSAVQFASDLAYDATSGILSWLVDASAEVDSTVDVGLGFQSLFDYTDNVNVADTDDLIGQKASLPTTSFSHLVLGLEFDPPNGPGARSLPGGYLTSQSHLERTIYVNSAPATGSAVRVTGAAGALGLTLNNGSVVIAQNLTSPDPSHPAQFFSAIPINVGRVLISDLESFIPTQTALGRLAADFRVVPDHTGTPEADRLTFRINNLNNPASSTVMLSSPNFPQMRQGLDLQVNMSALSESLDTWFRQVSEHVAQEVLRQSYPLVGDKLEQVTNFIEQLHETIDTALNVLSSFSVSDIETAIEGALQSFLGYPNGDFVQIDIASPTQVKLTLDISAAPILEKETVHTDLGLPALGIDLLGQLQVVGSYNFRVTFVLDVNEGFYVETDSDQISLAIDVDMLGQATGKLGFFEVIATASAPAPGQSAFHAEYVIDLTEPSGDNKLFLNELGEGSLVDAHTSGLEGQAHLRFSVEAVANEWLPSLETGLSVDWEFDGIGFESHNPPEVTYEGIQLHLGRLLEEVILPFFDAIQKIVQPITPAIDLLTKPLPGLSDYTESPVSFNNLAQEFAKSLPSDSQIRHSIESLADFIDTLTTIHRILNAIQADMGSGISLQLGQITFGGSNSPQYDARRSHLDSAVLNQAQPRSDLERQFSATGAASHVASELKASPGVLQLPIIEDPLNTMGWLLGIGEANLITWDLPSVTVSFPVGFNFPVFPGILASIFGGLEIGTNLKVGLDTAGFAAYAESRDLQDLFQGFYVSDRENADGTGGDVNELYIHGDLFAGAGIGGEVLGVGVSLVVGGGVFSEIGLDLLDHDHDGKMRGRDLSSADGCFALNGQVGVALEARAKAGIFKYELPITEATLAQGRTVLSCPFYNPPPPAILAGLNPSTGTLTLFMGPEAHQRDVSPNVEEEAYTVTVIGNELVVSAFGKAQFFDVNQVVNIEADGGSRDDTIILINVNKPTILYGGDGDDVIQGGSSIDFIDGGRGNDELHGGDNDDILVGGTGNDLIYGDAGQDRIFGQEGDDTLFGGDDSDHIETGSGRNKAYGDDGNDTIIGGAQADQIYGGDDDDYIEAGAGPDVIYGNAGIDTIRGEQGDDVIDGGDGGDFLYGDDGDDRLWGRKDSDELNGGRGMDYLNGGEDGDKLNGQDDSDEIDGEGGDDEIDGGLGDDLVYGRAGSDTILGGSGKDVIYAGLGGDFVSGGDDNDELYGEDGPDIILGGFGDDQIDGGPDADTIYGCAQDLLTADLPHGITDVDVLRGGSGSDRIAGGPSDDLIFGGEGADILLGNEGGDTIYGDDDVDTIYGFQLWSVWSPVDGGIDLPNWLYGGAGSDSIFGGPHNDFIRGSAGDDQISGQAGADTIYGDDGSDTIDGGPDVDLIDGGRGNDRIEGNDGSDFLYGNDGIDTLMGDLGDDLIAGNDQSDFLYGDEGEDTLYGGTGNDTMRGGSGNDLMFGDEGDDLIIGYSGSDTIQGGDDDDVIYGGTQNDTIRGGRGNDRLYGELGDDTLSGDEGNDTLEGGGGDDILDGDDGNDSLYGDDGQDTISGGQGDDYLFAGNGITNILYGDQGNDILIGSDDGTDDLKPSDSIYFGDFLYGGDGDDEIYGLGGGDIIDGGAGINIVRSGTHVGSLINGTEVPVDTGFAMPQGPEHRGLWAELSRSATDGGLTEMGGFEQSIFTTETGVYVAWVDWRNGNSEIYVAYHNNGVGAWTPLIGFGPYDSASGGGISNDSNQSRRPTLFKSDSSDSLVVAWTSIASDGTSTIEVAREDTNWARVANPGQTGTADHAQFVPFGNHSGLLFWLDDNQGANLTALAISQYTHIPACVSAFRPVGGIQRLPGNIDVKSFDAAAVEFRAVVALAYGSAANQDIAVFQVTGESADESILCPGVPNANAQEYVISSSWTTPALFTVTEGDTQNPDVGIQFITERGVLGEEQLATDIVVAWEFSSQRENQVDGVIIRIPLDGPTPPVEQLIPNYLGETPQLSATTVSNTLGFAAQPRVAMSYAGSFVAWQDDGVFAGQNKSSIFILSRDRDTSPGPYVLSELEHHDASGQGLSETGGSIQDLSLEVPRDGYLGSFPYVAWSEAATPLTSAITSQPVFGNNVYLRVTQPGLQALDDQLQGRKHRGAEGNLLSNDSNLMGEVPGFLAALDGRSVPRDLPLEFISPLGARVQAHSDGTIIYSTLGVSAFRQLKRGEFLTEELVYVVDNLVFQAEAIVQFVIYGDNRWRNANREIDTNDDGFVTPLDALLMINDLNRNGGRLLADDGPEGKYYPDVNDDGWISPADVLQVINFLNAGSLGESEITDLRASRVEPQIPPRESRIGWTVDYSEFFLTAVDELRSRRTRTSGRN
ncbi:MAG: hypothetical protein KDB03_01695 [Planctomycetales bacterium]|nr:hypothetical protein [Planctomycetales bacterium]